MNKLKTAALIPARYNSTRFPAKALAKISGQAMIVRVYESVKACQLIDQVYVATDDQRIKKAVEKAGGQVIMTDAKHQSGTDRIAEAAAEIEADLIVNVQGDEPLIRAQDIAPALEVFAQRPELKMSTLKRKITAAEAENPDLVKVITDQNDYALYFSRSPIPYYRAETVKNKNYYQHIGLYVYRRDFLLKYAKMQQTELEKAESLEQLRALENGYQIKVIETNAKLIGVDRKEDIKLVEKELAARQN
ncbi:3-deoxy-manno-octulosonate cytidylyltransferase [Halanaerobium praevalens]|uniref:3-deoxy-manno-octulosonate cytidylyltransferase n=1 Tax=Halanaerobium praevalens (strain ATCC 33744 / DSM 2228 / GSL) TaxID=572479 RepID=E3DMT7_HALPG|nr:3-deoxy-manno-octulosonate cytidylyltransferase [Halanaerobium praevalens]ADO76411.1 3-deoxy-D-manno-octulosonatecytidylyltransferase [Halanaerobium praevalens DSM 2228]